MNFERALIYIFLIAFTLTGCNQDVNMSVLSNDVHLHSDLVVPLGNASFNIADLLKNDLKISNITENENELIIQNLDSFKFTLPKLDLSNTNNAINQKFYPTQGQTLVLSQNTNIPAITTNDTLDLGINHNGSSDRIDSIYVSTASIKIKINVSNDLQATNPSNIHISLIFPQDKFRNMDGTSPTFQFSPKQYGTFDYINLKNFVINTSGHVSGLPLEIKFQMNTGNSSVTLGPNSYIECTMQMSNLKYTAAYGYLGASLSQENTFRQKIDFLSTFQNSSLRFANPKFKLWIKSNIGTYLMFKLNYLKSFSTQDTTVAQYASFDGVRHFSYTFTKPTSPGDSITDSIPTLDNKWGQLDSLFNTPVNPDMLEYNVSLSVDTNKVNSDPKPSFITPDAYLKTYIQATVPMYFNAGTYFELKDSLSNIFDQIAQINNEYTKGMIDSVKFVFNIKNGFPVGAQLNISFLDSLSNEINTDFIKSYDVASGKVDANGLVQTGQETSSQVLVSLNNSQLDQLKNAHKIKYILKIDGQDINSKIHFSKENTFKISAGILVYGNVNLRMNSNKR